MMIGHGTFDGVEYKFNLPGPDISGTELAALLNRIPASRQLVVDMTSASGGATPALKKENRTVITATKSGSEKNATLFARYWVEALRDPAADTDKNEVVSALEAFQYAQTKTAQFFTEQKRLATEHPQLEDRAARCHLPAGPLRVRGSHGDRPREARTRRQKRRDRKPDRRAQVSEGPDGSRRIQASDRGPAASTRQSCRRPSKSDRSLSRAAGGCACRCCYFPRQLPHPRKLCREAESLWRDHDYVEAQRRLSEPDQRTP